MEPDGFKFRATDLLIFVGLMTVLVIGMPWLVVIAGCMAALQTVGLLFRWVVPSRNHPVRRRRG